MATNNAYIADGASTSRPPMFLGGDYGYWRDRMTLFIQFNSLDLWDIVENGDNPVPTGPKPTWTAAQKEQVQMNKKAKYILLCALTKEEYNKIVSCDSAKEIWDRLEVLHEGTSQVKETKISMLVHKYESFKMEQGESIDDLAVRFLNIINQLKVLGKTYPTSEMAMKILRSLTPKWRPKVTAIQEAKDLKKLCLDELLGSLKTHEIELAAEEESSSSRHQKSLALKSTSVRKHNKNKALKVVEESETEEESEEDLDEEEMSMLVRKMTRAWKNRSKKGKEALARKEKKGKTKLENTTCFQCGEKGHFKNDCPKNKQTKKKFFKKKKALAATWSESEAEDSDSEEETEEEANLCFMADAHTDSDSDSSDEDTKVNFDIPSPSYHELSNLYDELLMDSKQLTTHFLTTKKALKNCESENELLKSKNEKLEQELQEMIKDNISLGELCKQLETDASVFVEKAETAMYQAQKTNALLIKDLEKMVNGTKMLDMMLGGQKPYLDHTGLGYTLVFHEDTLIPPTDREPIPTCLFCFKHGHSRERCPMLKRGTTSKAKSGTRKGTSKRTWNPQQPKPKARKANTKGPKKAWVPKTHFSVTAGTSLSSTPPPQ